MLQTPHATTSPHPTHTTHPRTWWTLQAKLSPYLFVAPFVLLFLVFMAYPLCRSLTLSFQKSAGPSRMEWIGFDNYLFLVRDPYFWKAIRNTLMYAAGFISIQLPLALLLAIALNNPNVRGRNAFRFAFFSTHLVGSVFVGVMCNFILGGRTGAINQVYTTFFPDAQPIGFLTNPSWTLPSLIGIQLWLSVGYAMIYFLAALQSVDRELYEAADVDGANVFQRFFHITLPGIRPVTAFLILVGTVGALQLFELPYVLFNGGGPNDRALTIVMYLYRNAFEQGNLGYASAVGWALVLLVGSISCVNLMISKRGQS